MTRMRPIRHLYLSFEEGAVPSTFREILFFMAGGVLEIAKALHRIADEMEHARVASRDKEERT